MHADLEPKDLSAQWQADVAQLAAPDAVKARIFAEIIEKHSEPHRRYHGVSHLRALFALLQKHAPDAGAALHFAIWWHDVIYDPQSAENEARSAELARLHLSELGADHALIDQIEALILATKNHWQGPSMGEGDVFLDADIAILGAPPETYDQYAQNVREEFAFAPDQAFRMGRSQFLVSAMGRTPMFRTALFEAAYGDTARANMRREYKRLQAG